MIREGFAPQSQFGGKILDAPFPYDLKEGAKGVQLAELGLASWEKRAWLDVPDL